MARVVTSGRRAVVDPLKFGQPVGGLLALLGVARCMPLLHGPQGCGAFAKALLTRHFREPVPVQTTAVTEVSAILGTTEALHTALDTITDAHAPDVVGVLTTGVTEVSGEDLDGALRTYRTARGARGSERRPLIVAASTPDFRGGLSDGWSATLRALVTGAEPGWLTPDERLVAVPVGVSLTAADLDDLAESVASFGLRPLLVPDLSTSVDGHLAPEWIPLTTGGTTATDLHRLSAAGTVLAVGATAGAAGAALAGRTGADSLAFGHASGLEAADALVAALQERVGRPAPPRLRHWRARLTDGLVDSHFVLGGARVAVAGEPEFLAAVVALLAEAGAKIVAAVAPTPDAVLETAPCDEVVIGDLLDLYERTAEAGAELIVASSHARDFAGQFGAAHLAAGFPVYDRLGAQLCGTAGYRASLHLLFRAANRLAEHRSSGHRATAAHTTAAHTTAAHTTAAHTTERTPC